MRRTFAIAAAVVLGTVAACAHAPTTGGQESSTSQATSGSYPYPFDPDNPEVNCAINNTVDCRPAGGP